MFRVNRVIYGVSLLCVCLCRVCLCVCLYVVNVSRLVDVGQTWLFIAKYGQD